MTPTTEQIARLKQDLERQPRLAEIFNALWWREVHDRINELSDDVRAQAETAFTTLYELLRDDDQIDHEPEEIEP